MAHDRGRVPFFIIAGIIAGFFLMLGTIAAALARGLRDGVSEARHALSPHRCQAWILDDDGYFYRCGALLPVGRSQDRCPRVKYPWISHHRSELPDGAQTRDEWFYADKHPRGPGAVLLATGKTLGALIGLVAFIGFLLAVYVIGPLQSR